LTEPVSLRRPRAIVVLHPTTADGRRIGFVVWLTEALVTADDTLGANAENGIVVSA
jgi:hypothetical protein